jgi:hypothetical protein
MAFLIQDGAGKRAGRRELGPMDDTAQLCGRLSKSRQNRMDTGDP